MTAFEQFRRNINTLIDTKKTTKSEISRHSGLSASLVRGYILGDTVPSMDQAEKIASAMGVPLSSLIGDSVPVLPNRVVSADSNRLAAISAILAANDSTILVLLDLIQKRGTGNKGKKSSDAS